MGAPTATFYCDLEEFIDNLDEVLLLGHWFDRPKVAAFHPIFA